MKTLTRMDPSVAFPEMDQPPGTADLHEALGAAAGLVDQFVAHLHSVHPAITAAWQFSPRAGWYRIHFVGKRRLFYLVPKQDDFRLSFILGPKAVTDLCSGPFAAPVEKLVASAKHYPEGLAFSFNRRTLEPNLVGVMLAAKLAH